MFCWNSVTSENKSCFEDSIEEHSGKSESKNKGEVS